MGGGGWGSYDVFIVGNLNMSLWVMDSMKIILILQQTQEK